MARKTLGTASVLLMTVVFSASNAFAGPKMEFGEEGWMSLDILGQVHYSFMEDAADEHDFYLRRARLITQGQIMDGVKVFAETDYPNAGKDGVDAKFIMQDAWVDIQLLGSDHWVKGGLINLPFSFENRSSAASLLGIDYNSETLKFVNDWTWRDTGVSFQGSFAKRVGYKAGLFDGYDNDNKNSDAKLRFTGRVDVAVIGIVPTGWFYAQDAISNKQYLYFGGGYDHQDKATMVDDTSAMDNKAWVFDFQSGFNLGGMLNLTVNGAWYDWDNSKFNGNTAFIESGLRYQKIIGTFKYSLEDPDSASQINNYTVGLQYNLKGNNIKGGIEYRWGDSSDWVLVGIQFLY